MHKKAAILGIKGIKLTNDEKVLIKTKKPWGIILFSRNIQNVKQLKHLIDNIKDCSKDRNYPILIDQEGGRIERLPVPPWRKLASPGQFGSLEQEIAAAAVEINARLIAMDLFELGIDVNCIPCLDVIDAQGHQVPSHLGKTG